MRFIRAAFARLAGMFTRFDIGQSVIGSTVSEVEIDLLDELDGTGTRKDN